MSNGKPPPEWALARPKPLIQSFYDLVFAPLRMVLLPDTVCENLHVTSLRSERFAIVLPHMSGRCLDIGAGDNMLLRLKEQRNNNKAESVGVDVVDWGGGCKILPSVSELPFDDDYFDTVTFVACINHIPEREEALREVARVLKPNGRILITMIGKLIGEIGHKLWWYSEDKHREVHSDEKMGMDEREVIELIENNGFKMIKIETFVYGLNSLYIAELK